MRPSFQLMYGVLVLLCMTSTASASIQAGHRNLRFVQDEIIVKYTSGTSRNEINSINQLHQTSVLSENRKGRFMKLKVHGQGRSIDKLVQQYRRDRRVEYAEPNYIVHAAMFPNDPYFHESWGLFNNGQTGGTTEADIFAPESWDVRSDASTVIVAVIDSGVDYTHPDLAPNMWTNDGEIAGNGIDDDNNGFVDDIRGWDFANGDNDPYDDHSHGTHVAGIIAAAGNNGTGSAGVCWSASIMPLKFLDATGNGTVTDAIEAIQYAVQKGAKLSNNSWGSEGFSQALKEAIGAADHLVIAAAGNSSSFTDITPFYPAAYDLPNIISTAATDHNDNLAAFSNYGPSTVHLGAPGVDILSTTPNESYEHMSGTSMAAPHVTGVAALLMAEFPASTIITVKDRILNAVSPAIGLRGRVATGGRLNGYDALLGKVSLEQPELTTIFYDDFEQENDPWTVQGETALWHLSGTRYSSISTSWHYGIDNTLNYDTGAANEGYLISPPIDLTTVTFSTLLFNHYLETEDDPNFDKAFVAISTDDGASFTEIFTSRSTDNIMAQETLDIAAYDGEIIRLRFSFDTVDKMYNDFEGWYIDDVSVIGQPAAPLPSLPPTADAGTGDTLSDADGDSFELYTLDGSASMDPEGFPLSYLWTEDQRVLGTAEVFTGSFSIGEHSITLTVTDNEGMSATDEVTVTVVANQPPVVDGGNDRSIDDEDGDGAETVLLNGSASSDPDGQIISYLWQDGETILGTAATLAVPLSIGEHVITLTVEDNGGATGADTFIVTVNDASIAPDARMHIADMDLLLMKRGSSYLGKSLVTVTDGNGMPLKGVSVSGRWELNASLLMVVTKGTDKNGVAVLESRKISVNSGDTLAFAVENLTLDGMTYIPADNAESSDSTHIP
ncbi:S8 family serine peptidase [Desulfosediminicola sp.]|uniref:S8 family serine peptidase n=1 Tax=Desulfosediminicola sp. TaxID=2886825 RepID=UPI003AF278A3